jgi:hypothetical protein
VFCENSTAEGVNLTEGDSPHSGSFEPEAEAANSAEEVEDIHLFFQCINGAVASVWMRSPRQRPQPVDDQRHHKAGAACSDENPDGDFSDPAYHRSTARTQSANTTPRRKQNVGA